MNWAFFKIAGENKKIDHSLKHFKRIIETLAMQDRNLFFRYINLCMKLINLYIYVFVYKKKEEEEVENSIPKSSCKQILLERNGGCKSNKFDVYCQFIS